MRALAIGACLLAGCYFPLTNGELGVGQAGLISVVPGSVRVAISGQTQLRAELLEPDGTRADPQPMFTFVSLDGSIATVDAGGRVTGVALGVTTIEVSDGVHGTLSVPVTVEASVPAGPVAMTCVPSIVLIAAGSSVTPMVVITDASGATVDASLVTFAVDDPAVATIEGSGMIRGDAIGRATLSATGPNGMLVGGCDLFVVSSGTGAGGRCEDVFEDYCWLDRHPYRFSQPGQSYPVRVRAGSYRVSGCGFPSGQFGTEQSPDEVIVDDPGVVGFFGGRMQALAPGWTRYRAMWRGVECGEVVVSVSVSLRGTWQMQCGNGDHGVLSLTSGGSGGVLASGGGAGSGAATFGITPASGNGQICTVDPTPMSCTEAASAGIATLRPALISGGQGTCASGGGCSMSVSHCGGRGTGSGILETPTRFHVGDCTYSLGGVATLGSCEAPMGACSTTGTPCAGVRIESCASVDLGACWTDVNDRRFACADCAAGITACSIAAADYASMLCGFR